MFAPYELLPQQLYKEKGIAGLRYLDNRIVPVLNYVRMVFNCPVYVNTWFFASKDKPGTLSSSGKPFDGRTIRFANMSDFKLFSDHSWGRAVDFDVVGRNSLDVQKTLIKTPVHSGKLKYLGVTGIEDGTEGWTHLTFSDLTTSGLEQINGIYLIPIPK